MCISKWECITSKQKLKLQLKNTQGLSDQTLVRSHGAFLLVQAETQESHWKQPLSKSPTLHFGLWKTVPGTLEQFHPTHYNLHPSNNITLPNWTVTTTSNWPFASDFCSQQHWKIEENSAWIYQSTWANRTISKISLSLSVSNPWYVGYRRTSFRASSGSWTDRNVSQEVQFSPLPFIFLYIDLVSLFSLWMYVFCNFCTVTYL